MHHIFLFSLFYISIIFMNNTGIFFFSIHEVSLNYALESISTLYLTSLWTTYIFASIFALYLTYLWTIYLNQFPSISDINMNLFVLYIKAVYELYIWIDFLSISNISMKWELESISTLYLTSQWIVQSTLRIVFILYLTGLWNVKIISILYNLSMKCRLESNVYIYF